MSVLQSAGTGSTTIKPSTTAGGPPTIEQPLPGYGAFFGTVLSPVLVSVQYLLIFAISLTGFSDTHKYNAGVRGFPSALSRCVETSKKTPPHFIAFVFGWEFTKALVFVALALPWIVISFVLLLVMVASSALLTELGQDVGAIFALVVFGVVQILGIYALAVMLVAMDATAVAVFVSDDVVVTDEESAPKRPDDD